MPIRLAWAVALLSICGQAAVFHRAAGRTSSISLRKRLHVNPLITEPDTLEIDWGGAFSRSGDYTLPAALRYTPEGTHPWWGRTEWSVSFDSLVSAVPVDQRVSQFGDRINLQANCVTHDGPRLDIAIAPQVSFLLRGADGVRAGATAIARYDWGRNSAGATFSWTGATAATPSNPAGTFDLGAGYGRRLAASGALGRLTPHVNWLGERSTGVGRQVSVFEGVECQITGNVALDFSGQHFSVWGGPTDHQVAVGLTVSTGKLHRKRR